MGAKCFEKWLYHLLGTKKAQHTYVGQVGMLIGGITIIGNMPSEAFNRRLDKDQKNGWQKASFP